jgi:glucose/arabinose dehydrogenase
MAALRGERLWRLDLDDDSGAVVGREELLSGEAGRLRDVQQAPDDSLWVLTSNRDGRGSPVPENDRILQLAPAKG